MPIFNLKNRSKLLSPPVHTADFNFAMLDDPQLPNSTSQLSQIVLIVLAFLYVITKTLAIVIVGKMIASPVGPISAGSIVAPFWFLFNDMIAELFGYKVSRLIFWSGELADITFVYATVLILKLPSPEGWLGASSFALVLGQLPRIYFAQLVAIMVGWYINTKFLLRWKLLIDGRLYWLRSVASSAMGEILFSIIAASIIMSGLMSAWSSNSESHYKLVIHLVIWSALLKIIFTAIFTIPAAIIVSYLKKLGIDSYPRKINPFNVGNPITTPSP